MEASILMSQCHLVHVYYNFYAFDVCFMDVFPFLVERGRRCYLLLFYWSLMRAVRKKREAAEWLSELAMLCMQEVK